MKQAAKCHSPHYHQVYEHLGARDIHAIASCAMAPPQSRASTHTPSHWPRVASPNERHYTRQCSTWLAKHACCARNRQQNRRLISRARCRGGCPSAHASCCSCPSTSVLRGREGVRARGWQGDHCGLTIAGTAAHQGGRRAAPSAAATTRSQPRMAAVRVCECEHKQHMWVHAASASCKRQPTTNSPPGDAAARGRSLGCWTRPTPAGTG